MGDFAGLGLLRRCQHLHFFLFRRKLEDSALPSEPLPRKRRGRLSKWRPNPPVPLRSLPTRNLQEVAVRDQATRRSDLVSFKFSKKKTTKTSVVTLQVRKKDDEDISNHY